MTGIIDLAAVVLFLLGVGVWLKNEHIFGFIGTSLGIRIMAACFGLLTLESIIESILY